MKYMQWFKQTLYKVSPGPYKTGDLIILLKSNSVQHISLHFVALHFEKRAALKKSLGHNCKDSDFHSTCPLKPEKIREVVKLHSNLHLYSQVRFKSYFKRVIRFYKPFSTLPLHFAKSYISGKELRYKVLEPNPHFWLSIPQLLSAALERLACPERSRRATFPSQNRESSSL